MYNILYKILYYIRDSNKGWFLGDQITKSNTNFF